MAVLTFFKALFHSTIDFHQRHRENLQLERPQKSQNLIASPKQHQKFDGARSGWRNTRRTVDQLQ